MGAWGMGNVSCAALAAAEGEWLQVVSELRQRLQSGLSVALS
jgi:hypothetical protein